MLTLTKRHTGYTHISAHTHTQGRYNMINGGVSLTLINYNQIKDFISLNLGAVFGHTVNQRCVMFASRYFSFLPTKLTFK